MAPLASDCGRFQLPCTGQQLRNVSGRLARQCPVFRMKGRLPKPYPRGLGIAASAAQGFRRLTVWRPSALCSSFGRAMHIGTGRSGCVSEGCSMRCPAVEERGPSIAEWQLRDETRPEGILKRLWEFGAKPALVAAMFFVAAARPSLARPSG